MKVIDDSVDQVLGKSAGFEICNILIYNLDFKLYIECFNFQNLREVTLSQAN